MSGWDTVDMAAALPDEPNAGGGWSLAPTQETVEQPAVEPAAEAPTAEKKNPQEHGWVETQKYDYATYNKSNKELMAAQESAEQAEGGDFLAGGIGGGDWANKAPVYEWKDEYGDVGPRFEELEQQLFGSEHVRQGIRFEKIISIDVIQEGNIRINPIQNFDDAGLHPAMRENVRLAGYHVPTPIQQYVLPAIFKGHDVVACAQTGSGKTAAFLIPILSKLMGKAKKLAAFRGNPANMAPGETYRAEPLVLIVCPNRELATQIFDEARRFCYRTMLRPCVVYGGCPLREQIPLLQKGCDLLIATPGRLIDFMSRPAILTLKRLKYMVIDEADEMVSADWENELKQIMSGGDQEEGNINYLMFSATFPKIARDLAKAHLAHDHVRIRVGRAGSTHCNIKQDIVFVEAPSKRKALFDLLMSAPPVRTIIFVNSKRTADEIDDYLFNSDIPCTSIHSDRTQKEREDSIRAFRNGKAPVLIATGVSARGLDIHNVMHVINFDLPSALYGGIEEYTHRIGRTGRIGNLGLATSFYNERDSDIGETLVKTLLETDQVIPDFLEQYVPEGFTLKEGDEEDKGHHYGGKVEDLKFEADSDFGDGDDGEPSAEGGDANTGGGWGSAPVAEETGSEPAGWGASAPVAAPLQQPAPVASGGWGASAPVAPPVQQPAPVASGGWSAPAPVAPPVQQPAPVASGGWSAPAPVAAPVLQAAPAASGWGVPQPQPAQSANNGWGGSSGRPAW